MLLAIRARQGCECPLVEVARGTEAKGKLPLYGSCTPSFWSALHNIWDIIATQNSLAVDTYQFLDTSLPHSFKKFFTQVYYECAEGLIFRSNDFAY